MSIKEIKGFADEASEFRKAIEREHLEFGKKLDSLKPEERKKLIIERLEQGEKYLDELFDTNQKK